MLDQGTIATVVGALGTLGVAAFFLRRSRESGALSPRYSAAGVQVPGRGAHGRSTLVSDEKPQQFRQFIGAKFQVDEFVASLIREGYCDCWRDRAIVQAYLAWTRDRSIEPVPKTIVLNLLAEHPNVERSRKRLKHPKTGRVLKLPSGTPERGTFYTVHERAYATVPIGVGLPKKKGVRKGPGESRAKVRAKTYSDHGMPRRIAA